MPIQRQDKLLHQELLFNLSNFDDNLDASHYLQVFETNITDLKEDTPLLERQLSYFQQDGAPKATTLLL